MPTTIYGPEGIVWEQQLPGIDVLDVQPGGPGAVPGVEYVAARDLVVAAMGSAFVVFDATTFEIVHEEWVGPHIWGIDLTDDSSVLALAAGADTVLYRTSDWLQIATISGVFSLDVEFAPGSTDVLLHSGSAVWSVTSSGSVVTSFSSLPAPVTFSSVNGVAWGKDASTLVVATGGQPLLWEVAVGDPLALVRSAPMPVVGVGPRLRPLHRIGPTIYSDAGFAIDATTLATVESGTSGTQVWGRTGTPAIIRSSGTRVEFTTENGTERRFTLPGSAVSAPVWFLPLSGDRFMFVQASSHLRVGDAGVLSSALGDYTALTPARIFDTRVPIGQDTAGGLAGGVPRAVRVTGVGGVPATGVSAVVVNVTAVNATTPTYLSLSPTGADLPDASNVNVDAATARPGLAVANLATVTPGTDGRVVLFSPAGTVDVALDVVGFYADETGPHGARYVPLAAPDRRADTRDGDLGGQLGPGATRRLDLSELVGTRPGITAAVLQVTAIAPTEPSFVTVYPGDVERPGVSNINLLPGRTTPNLAIVRVPADGAVDLFNVAGGVDLAVDLVGFYERRNTTHPDQGGRFLAFGPRRVLDTRSAGPFDGSVPPDAGVVFRGTTLGWGSVAAVLDTDVGWTLVVNLTAVSPTSAGFLSVVPFDADSRTIGTITTSNVNFSPGEVRSSQSYVTADPDWLVYNSHGDTHALVDLFGFMVPDAPQPVVPIFAI